MTRCLDIDGRERRLLRRLAGSSPAMQRLRGALARVAPYPTTVLLVGETGSGKGEAAKALHEVSSRAEEPFVHVDCAGLSDALLAAELWRVARGAYTGADSSRPGRFEAAAAGTLLLDEVGELSLGGQKKLLRVLEEGDYERVGEIQSRKLSARVIAATNVDLESAVSAGRFRADLYYRLSVFVVEVPPLRERREDLPVWIEVARERVARRLNCPPPRLSSAALESIRRHEWPGNFREFLHVIESATIRAAGEEIGGGLISALISRQGVGRSDPLRSNLRRDSAAAGKAGERIKQEDLARVLDEADGNLSLAARRLGIPRSTLRYRMGLDDVAARRQGPEG